MSIAQFFNLSKYTGIIAYPNKRPASLKLELENLPSSGLISKYGVCGAYNDEQLDQYGERFTQQLEAWKKANQAKK